MVQPVVLLSIPGLREQDLSQMPELSRLGGGERATLVPSFPCVTWPVQANMLTGVLANQHGVTANGFYWRQSREVEMWTAWNEKITAPQIWDRLQSVEPPRTSAAWFPMLSKGSNAEYVCMPAPIHNPDGSESLWCYTKPRELYGELRDTLGHFPLQHFWGPLANIKATSWIAGSAVVAAKKFGPDFYYIYLPHLDYAAQKSGPDSAAAKAALAELDGVIGELVTGIEAAATTRPLWLAASEYAIVPVDHVSYPNRVLRNAGLLTVREEDDGEHLDFDQSCAWALVDHQFSHVYVRDAEATLIDEVRKLFLHHPGIDEVLDRDAQAKYGLDHERSGEIVLISKPTSWQAYYWWLDDARAPGFARTVDIHRKPGYDPVELHIDMATKSIPLDATLIRGSHGAPARDANQCGVLLSSMPNVIGSDRVRDVDVAGLVLRQFDKKGMSPI